MARRKLKNCSYEFPFHVASRCINREWFGITMPEVWQIMAEQLHFVGHAFDLKILSFVLMNNHWHLLASAPLGNLSPAIAYFTRETSRALIRNSGRINMTYGGRFFRSEIRSAHYYLNAYKYIYRNPVQANVCAKVEDYRWSTLRGLLGLEHLLIPVVDDRTLFSDVEGTLGWLNQPVDGEDWESIRKALQKKVFKLSKNKARKPNHLETKLL